MLQKALNKIVSSTLFLLCLKEKQNEDSENLFLKYLQFFVDVAGVFFPWVIVLCHLGMPMPSRVFRGMDRGIWVQMCLCLIPRDISELRAESGDATAACSWA